MLFPLIGLALATVVCAVIGAAIIAVHPRWKLTSTNISLFVIGSFAAAICFSRVYTWFFADENRHLSSSAAVTGYLVMLFVAILMGGTLSIFLGRKLFKPSE